MLLDAKADPNYQKAEGKDIALPSLHLIASGNGDVEMIGPLIEAKADINIELHNAPGFTPLHTAANAGNVDVIKVLVDARADLGVKTADEGATPLDVASKIHQTKVVEYLESIKAPSGVPRQQSDTQAASTHDK